MIGSLRGILRAKSPTELTLEVNGIGYIVSVSLSTSQQVGAVNDTVTLLTHLHVRENALQLFGFATEQERRIFELLISVSGIGPRTALGILSGSSPDELTVAIAGRNIENLMALPNVGRKTAERLILELREKVSPGAEPTRTAPSAGSAEARRADALMALSALGFPRPVAEKALRQVLSEEKDSALSVEELIKRALRRTGR